MHTAASRSRVLALCTSALLAATSTASAQPAGPGPNAHAEPAPHEPSDPPATHLTGHSEQPGEFWTRGKIASAGGLGGFYTALTVWAYFAWYHNKPQNLYFKVNGDGGFGVDTYAGGSDKLGHFWSNHVISRGTTEMLIAGGWKPLPASMIASGLSLAFFTFVEVKDGYYYEFSTGDMIGNAGGALLSALLINEPAIDRLIDFRIDYRPTHEYREGFKDGDVNFAEDYSGQTYLLALHLDGIPGLTDSKWSSWARFVDVVGGYQSINYKPEPFDPDAIESQHLFLGAALNVQAILAELYGEREQRGRSRASHRAAHFVFEFVSPPYTTLRVTEASRSASGM